MEAAVSASLGAVSPLLRKLDLLLSSEYRLRKQLKDGISLLKEDVEEISIALLELSALETPSLRGKCWMEEARQLSYDVEDFIDGIILRLTGDDAKMRYMKSSKVGRVKIARLPEKPKRSTRIARIAKFRSLLCETSERHERYQLDSCSSSSSHVITGHVQVAASYGDPTNLVGISDSSVKLIKMLRVDEVEHRLEVVSILGSAGVGKTTLAKEIYHQLRGQFEFRAFVRVSRKPDMRRLLKAVLAQAEKHHQPSFEAGPMQNLIDSVNKYLKDKRYIIVIDDVWEEEVWDIVSNAFPGGNNRSRIIATTEKLNVALKCCGYLPSNIFTMKPLSIQDSGKLFFSRVFGFQHGCPEEVKKVSFDIIRKCGGLPLTIISLAGLLARQPDYPELWQHLQDCFCSILNRSHTVKAIQKEILNLTYNSLPNCLKTCLLYFSMFPEGYTIQKVHLLKQWIAEGFIDTAERNETEEIAERYFDELISRGMIQPSHVKYNDEVVSCTVHHIVHDFIIHKSKEEEFIAPIDYSRAITGIYTKARRLSLQFSSPKYAKQTGAITMRQLRSLAFFGLMKCMPPIGKFNLLRVLILEFRGYPDGPTSLNLSRIYRLILLRYLNISGDVVVELPEQLRMLQYLETLDITAKLRVVPLDLVHVQSLLHLSLRDATKLPDGIGRIKSLSTLFYFDISHNSEDNLWSLGKLTNLKYLHLTCYAVLSHEHLKRKLMILVSSLRKLINLKSLTLAPGALEAVSFLDPSSSISCPSAFLQRLELLPPICFFPRLPIWIGQLNKLRILKIVVKELTGDNISNLIGLPTLRVLMLYIRSAVEETIFFRAIAFPALRYLKISCSAISLAFQAGTMQKLRKLKLCFNSHRGAMLVGIEHLLNLLDIAGRFGKHPSADKFDRRIVESSFEDAIRKHPRCPIINIKWVDLIEEEYTPVQKQHSMQLQDLSGEYENLVNEYTEDLNKHVGSSFSGFLDQPSIFPLHGIKSDEASDHLALASTLQDESAEPIKLDFSLLEVITNNFSGEQEIGSGEFGVVYKGKLRDGIVAVKRLYGGLEETVHHGQFARILECLMSTRHRNLLRFLGYCVKSLYSGHQEMLLCFEFLQTGNLQKHITDESCGLEWHKRYMIIKGICDGLFYLHEKSIIHLDLKPENIVLDVNMVPKISDYGLLCGGRPTWTHSATLSHMAPEYFEGGVINIKSDVYSLGVIIMQIVTGHKYRTDMEEVLEGWWNRLKSDAASKHRALQRAYHQVEVCIEMGLKCMHRDPGSRPVVREIIDSLEITEQSVRSDTSLGSLLKAESDEESKTGATWSRSRKYFANVMPEIPQVATPRSGVDLSPKVVVDHEGRASSRKKKMKSGCRKMKASTAAVGTMQRLFDTIREVFLDSSPGFVPPLEAVARLSGQLNALKPDDVGINSSMPCFKHNDSKGPPIVTYLHFYDCPKFSFGIFCLPKSAVIPLHNHPGMTVFSKILFGSMHLKSYDWATSYPSSHTDALETSDEKARLAKVNSDGVFDASAETLVLYPENGGNLHSYTALTPCAVLDVMGPPYNRADGRDCAYYSETPYWSLRGRDGQYSWLKEIPATFEMKGLMMSRKFVE